MKFRFVYDAEDGFEQNPYLYLLPDQESRAVLPFQQRWRSESEDKPGLIQVEDRPREIWVSNVAEAGQALLGAELAKQIMDGTHQEVTGEAVVEIDGFSAGYECDRPAFATRLVAMKQQLAVPNAIKPSSPSGC